MYRGIYVKREGTPGYKGPAVYLLTGKVQGYLISNWTASNASIHRQTTTTINDNAWHHVVVTYDGSGNDTGMLCYIDGSLDTTFATQSSRTTVGTNTTTNSFNARVGSASDNTGQGINGLIDEVAVWNIVLTADQVSALYNNGDGANIESGL